ncbi:hypothetical protein B0H63DRAFT_565679 [Podospora didyma]|uniref:F-box domain-containing protein n=1 Tax=Podospora didyma TaxID=330526 RepID=A0AAE0K1N8_9PEZI|nr:hypothetical protein B0H63DRAFT_565679 [Podospora didyma]
MGSWDVYCAICGGPTIDVEVARKPRTQRFKRRRAREAAKRKAENMPDNHPVHFPSDTETMEERETRKAAGEALSSEDDSDSGESLCSEEEDSTYDPEILSEEDAAWTRSIKVLGCSPGEPTEEKVFITGDYHYTNYGRVEAQDTEPDSNVEALDLACYYDYTGSSTVVFPFHPCCWELLVRRITGGTDFYQLNKAALYNIMTGLSSECSQRLALDYGNPCPQDEQFWGSFPGEEIFAKQPTGDGTFEALVRTAISSNEFRLPAWHPEEDRLTSIRSGRDVFRAVPYDIIYQITELTPTSAVLALCKASRVVHALLRGNVGFWRHRIARELPWFYELIPLMSDPERVSDLNLTKVLSWARKVSEPRLGMSGPFMSLANRRRIWTVCEQLAELYRKQTSESNEAALRATDDV